MASAAAFSASRLAALFWAARRWAFHQCTCLSYVEEEEDGGSDAPVDLGLLNQSILAHRVLIVVMLLVPWCVGGVVGVRVSVLEGEDAVLVCLRVEQLHEDSRVSVGVCIVCREGRRKGV